MRVRRSRSALAILTLRSLPQVRAACSAWALNQPASLLRQSAHSVEPHRSVRASQTVQPQHLFAKSVGHALRLEPMPQRRELPHHVALHARHHAAIVDHDQSVHRALSAPHVRSASHESDASAARQRQR